MPRLCHVVLIGLCLGLASSCGRADSAPAVDRIESAGAVIRAPVPGDPSCPRTGLWQPCALVDRIKRAGLSFVPTGDSVTVRFLDVPGVRYRVAATDTLLAFFFADSLALGTSLAPLDTVRMAPPKDTTSPWQSTPSVIRSGNLLVLYFASSARQEERMRLAIMAGAPARPTKR